MTRVLALFTCFNRKEKSVHAVESLISGNPQMDFTFLVVDDGSTDGTAEALQKFPVRILRGDGSLFYSRGMGLGMDTLLREKTDYDYLLMMNDDVAFFPRCIEALATQSGGRDVIVGATRDTRGNLSYSGIRYEKGIHYRFMNPGEAQEADTMNANCVLIPYDLFRKTGSMDKHYHHSLGDFDYGFALRQEGHITAAPSLRSMFALRLRPARAVLRRSMSQARIISEMFLILQVLPANAILPVFRLRWIMRTAHTFDFCRKAEPSSAIFRHFRCIRRKPVRIFAAIRRIKLCPC